MDRDGLWLVSRGRERAWWLLAVAIGAAVLVAVIAKIKGAPAWIQLTCLAVGTGLGLFVVELRARRAQDDRTAVVVRENVADGSERLRRLRDVGIEDAGVHRATEDVAYVRREVEPEVERLLRVERRVLIVGPSMSGKTRLALHVTKHGPRQLRGRIPALRADRLRRGRALRAVEDLDEEIEKLEDLLFDDRPRDPDVQRRSFAVRKSLVTLRRVVLPMRGVVNTLLRRDIKVIAEEMTPYFQDVYDHVLRATEWTESLRDPVTTILATNLTIQGNRLNVITKKVTSWAAIIAVPTAIIGFYGRTCPTPATPGSVGSSGPARSSLCSRSSCT